jgi:hypothetical protein
MSLIYIVTQKAYIIEEEGKISINDSFDKRKIERPQEREFSSWWQSVLPMNCYPMTMTCYPFSQRRGPN